MKYRVMLVDERPERLAFISEKLAQDGFEVVACARPGDDLLAEVRRHRPEILIIDLDAPGTDTLERLRGVQAAAPRPMVLFTQDEQEQTIRQAVAAGVNAYIVDGLERRRVRPIVEAALARFGQFQALGKELEKTKSQLQERKLVEKAKGILMRERGLSEEDAYQALRKAAMDRNRRMAEIAEGIVTAQEMLRGGS